MKYLLLIASIFLTTNVFAGWYNCYSYKGQIAGANVHVYLQLMEINATSRDTIPVSGIYVYDNHNDPIELRGALIKETILDLTEYHDNVKFANLKFQWDQQSLDGLWKSDKKSYKITLTKIGSLSDLKMEYTNKPTEILMASSFREEFLIGIYYKERDDNRARLSELRILSKKTNEVNQVIKFSRNDRPVGNVSTVIFDNVRAWENLDKGERAIEVDEDDGHMGQSFFITYNRENKKFIRN